MNDIEIEARLRRTYQVVAARTVVTPFTLPDPSRGPLPSAASSHRRARRTVALVAAGLAVGLGTVAVVGGSGDRGDGAGEPDVEAAQGPAAPNTIEPLPASPLPARYAHSGVWTGTEMIVVGGINDDDNDGEFDETDAASRRGGAAAYDPAARSWRTLADPPEVIDGSTSAVWTGEEMVVFATDWDDTINAGAPPDQAAGAVYDPAEDAWRETAPIPGEIGDLHPDISAFWLGGRVVVLGVHPPDGSSEPGLAGNGAAAYDPATDEWEALGDVPLPFEPGRAVSTGDEVIVVGPDRAPDYEGSPDPDAVMEAAALDPADGTWRALPAPPLPARTHPVVAWTGIELVVVGGYDFGGETPLSDGARLDPATGAWSALPEAPAAIPPQDPAGPGGAAVGRRVVAITTGSGREGPPLVLDLATGTWHAGPPWPTPREGGDARVSTDRQILTWGGYRGDGATAEGYAFTPPGPS